MKTLRPNFIVGIGGSAGGVEAYQALLDAMPPNTDMAFVVIAHLMPSASSQLAQILSRHTKMPVKVALECMSIRKNHVYVIPPDADLFMENYKFKVVSPRMVRNNQIDLFLTSLAEAMGANLIGIILSGYDGDGSEGCKKIKEKKRNNLFSRHNCRSKRHASQCSSHRLR
ncbi:MAG: chemotaxis protein CheB [Oligoflexia bacterium]|nr:chemotaxis protein CheB [Oligoflexia bacterium]